VVPRGTADAIVLAVLLFEAAFSLVLLPPEQPPKTRLKIKTIERNNILNLVTRTFLPSPSPDKPEPKFPNNKIH
jgi:hypothetical protein